jgi:hypothetical protein
MIKWLSKLLLENFPLGNSIDGSVGVSAGGAGVSVGGIGVSFGRTGVVAGGTFVAVDASSALVQPAQFNAINIANMMKLICFMIPSLFY